MNKIILLGFCILSLGFLNAQTFTNSTGGAIPDNGAGFTCYPVTVSGVGNINNTSGLKSVCLNIVHPRSGDLIIRLQAPDGTYIPLATEAGADDPNFTNTCFIATGLDIGFATAPFTGNYAPQAPLGWFNNNINANGTWSLCIRDATASNVGSLSNFTISFGTSPAQFPMSSCNGNLPPSNFCQYAPLICNTNNYCGSTNDTYSAYTWPQLSAITCSASMQIFNNSFLKFVASAATATFNVRATNTLVNDGISILAFSGTCGSGAVVAKGCINQITPSATATVFTATGLTAGTTYYLMLDGKNGDACDYVIAATSGVSFTSGAATFAAIPAFCAGATAPSLPTTSTNSISGTWSPSSVSNTASGMYTFTPSAGQCSTTPVVISITVNPSPMPTFATIPAFCTGTTAPILPTTSINGFMGTWSPSTVSNTAAATYTFTPNIGQCATTATLSTTLTTATTPTFNIIGPFCSGSTAPVLQTTSNNSITGAWSPSVVSNTASGLYSFTPTAGQCATAASINITVNPRATPTFAAIPAFCAGTTAPTLPTTSTNGYIGTWSPSTVSNTASATYTFTPNSGQCATTATLNITVTTATTPTFNTIAPFCIGSTAPVLQTTSNNSITGTWSPSVVSNTASGLYTFTPNAGQCATGASINITVNPNVTPTFTAIPAFCAGTTAPTLLTTSTNGVVGTWSPSVISNIASATYTFTPNAGQCATTTSINTTVNPSITPIFTAIPAFCSGTTAPTLPTTSTNGVAGTWSPSTVSNTASATYTFTPSSGQCATTATLNTTVTTSTMPTFNTIAPFCIGSTAPVLQTTSNNSITGTWNPNVVSNTASGLYTFTPNAGQCATGASINITVNPSVTPTFTAIPAFCAGTTAPTLPTTSTNGVTGTWSPSTISNTTSATYTFTPNAGQCATTTSINTTVNPNITPTFIAIPAFCAGTTPPTLPTTSTNGVAGIWSPSTVSNTASATYTFTPNSGQCATTATLNTTVTTATTPTFNTIAPFCIGSTAPVLQTTSNNSITGTWSPSVVSNTASGLYTFTPNAGQCATGASINITVNPSVTPTFNAISAFCLGTTAPILPTTSTNGIVGTWSPSTVSNTTSATYTFTPNSGQCATTATLNTTVTMSTTPTFNTIAPFCSGSTAPVLQTTSNNSITGTWSPSIVSNTTSATYTFTPNTGQCAIATSINITVNAPVATPSITASGPVALCYPTGSVTLTSSAANGNQWFRDGFSISGATSTTLLVNNLNGSFTVKSTIAGCVSAASNAIVVSFTITPLQPSISATGTNGFTNCLGNINTLDASTNVGLQWYKDGFLIPGFTNTSYGTTQTGTYTITSTLNGCTSPVSPGFTVTFYPVPSTPTVTPSGSTAICTGGSVLLTSSATVGNQWFKDGTLIIGATGTTYSATAAGSYTVKSTVNNCGSAISTTTLVSVNAIPNAPTVSPSGAVAACTGSTTTLTSSAATGNQWYKDGVLITGATATTYGATSNGVYTVTTNNSGCTSTASAGTTITISSVPTAPTIMAGSATTICTGGSVVLSSSAATNNQWYNGGVLISGATGNTYNAIAAGSYTVLISNGTCISAQSAAIVVTLNAIPTTPIITAGTATTFCAGGSVILTSSAATGNQWYKDGILISGATATNYTANAAGSYTVITTASSCPSAASAATVVTVNAIPATPTITAGTAITFCAGGSVILTSSAATGNQWYKDGTLISGATATNYTANTAGSYTVIATASSCPSAASTATVVTVNAIPTTPTITAGTSTTFCAGGSVVLTSNAATGNQWFNGASAIAGATNTTYIANTSGAYTVKQTVNGCSSASSNNLVVTANALPAIPVLTAVGNALSTPAGFAGYRWFLNNVVIIGATTNTYTATAIGIYKVEITDANGCKNTSADYNHTSTSFNNITIEGASIKLLQNPSNNILSINISNAGLNAKFNAILIDASGKTIARKIMQNGNNQMVVSAIASGFYMLRIVGNKKWETIKVAIMH